MSIFVSLVVAYSRATRSIGLRNALPWPRISTDLQRFRALTSGHSIIMGRHTFESPEVSSIPLPNRRNVILSSQLGWAPPAGVVRAEDWNEAIMLADSGFGGAGYDDGELVLQADEQTHTESRPQSLALISNTTAVVIPHTQPKPKQQVFVVGGEMVYRKALQNEQAQFIFATEIEGNWPGDAFFPQLDTNWLQLHPHECPRGWAQLDPITENGVTYSFVTFQRQF